MVHAYCRLFTSGDSLINMFRYLSSYFLILSCLSHLLCCGIPFFLGLTTFAATVGLSSLFFFDLTWFENIDVNFDQWNDEYDYAPHGQPLDEPRWVIAQL